MIQVRNVPDAVHRKPKARAALAGMSLPAYALRELESGLEQPTTAELVERLSSRKPARVRPSAAVAIREEREQR